MNNSTNAERKAMILIGSVVGILAIGMIVLCLNVPVLHDVVEDIGYPTVSFSAMATEEVSDNILLKKKIGMGPFVMKMFSGSEEELGSAEYRSTMDNMKIFVNFGAESSESDELYQLYSELFGISDIEELKGSSRLLTLAEGYINQYNCDYLVLECGKYGNILMFETYINDASCYFTFGLAYSDSVVTEEQLTNAIQYMHDAMTTLEFKGGYSDSDNDDLSPEERKKGIERALEKEEEYQSMLAYMTDEEREAYYNQLMEEVSEEQGSIEYVDYGDESDDDYEEGTEFRYPIYTEQELPLDIMYLVIEHLYASGEHTAVLEGMSGEEYQPVFRGIKPEEGKEINVFEINKEQCGGYYVFKTNSDSMVVDTYSVTDTNDFAEYWSGMTYDEYVEFLEQKNE